MFPRNVYKKNLAPLLLIHFIFFSILRFACPWPSDELPKEQTFWGYEPLLHKMTLNSSFRKAFLLWLFSWHPSPSMSIFFYEFRTLLFRAYKDVCYFLTTLTPFSRLLDTTIEKMVLPFSEMDLCYYPKKTQIMKSCFF